MLTYFGMILVCMLLTHLFMRSTRLARSGIFQPREIPVKRKLSLYIFLAAVPLILVSGFRFNVGTDYSTYLRLDSYIGSVFFGLNPVHCEPLYLLIIKFAKLFDNYQIVYFLTGLCFAVFIINFLYYSSEDLVFSILLLLLSGVFSQSLNHMKQMLAVSIVFYAFRFLLNKGCLKYIACVLIAAMIHDTALIFLFFVFYDKVRINKKLIFIIFMLVYVFKDHIYSFCYHILSIFNYYSYYFHTRYVRDTSTALLLLNVAIFLFMLFCVKAEVKEEDKKRDRLYSLIQYIIVFICIIALPNSTRIVFMFIPIQLISIPYYLNRLKPGLEKYKRFFKFGFFIVYLTFFIYTIGICNLGETLPYETVFTSN